MVSETTVTRPGWQGAATQTVSYGWDEVGNRLAKTNGGTVVSYAYSNGNNRLIGWTATSTNGFAGAARANVLGYSSETIVTNSWLGQLWVSNSVAVTPSVSGTNFNAEAVPVGLGTQNIVAAISDLAGNPGYATNTIVMRIATNGSYLFNDAGCVTNIAYVGDGLTNSIALTWDSLYQLTEVKTNGVAVERNGFDALGRRVWSWDGTTTNYFVWDGDQIVAEVGATGALRRAYVYAGLDFPLAMTVYTGATPVTYFYLTDHLGSVAAVADSGGNIVESYRYDAWGRTSVFDANNNPLTESAIGNRILWQGREYNFRSGLYFFRSRFYSPIEGRWLSNDSIGIAGGLDQYVFAGNNPVNYTDPLGESWIGKIGKYGVTKALRTKTARELLRKGYNMATKGMSKREMKREIRKTFPGRKAAYHTDDVTAREFGPHAQPTVKDFTRGQHLFESETYDFARNTVGAMTVTHYLGNNWFSKVADFFNPLSIGQDVVGILDEVQGIIGDEGETTESVWK